MNQIQGFVRLFFVVGGAALLGGVVMGLHIRSFVAHAQSVPGTVVRMEQKPGSDDGTVYHPVVEFTKVSGQQATLTGYGSNPPAYEAGEVVRVLYDPLDPGEARIDDFWSLWGASAGLAALGLLFIGITSGIAWAARSGAHHKQDLRVNGTPIKTELMGVERNERLEVNGTNPWRITSRWVDPASGKARTFHSENLWYDPTEFLKINQVTVLIDPRKPKRYYMDISFLPERA